MNLERINIFVSKLLKSKRVDDLLALCEQEREYLAHKYPHSLASLKNAFTAYRNVIKQRIPEDFVVRGKLVFPYILKIIKLTKAQTLEFNGNRHKQVNEEMSNRREFSLVDSYLQKAESLLESSNYLELIIALCALTGRRVAEIGCTAEFEIVNSKEVLFKGQLKLKGRENFEDYIIPVLTDSQKIRMALLKLRKLKPDFKICSLSKFHDSTSSNIYATYQKHFSTFYEAPHRPKDMRALYAEIYSRRFYKNSKMAPHKYYAVILGHGEEDNQTLNSYFDFYIPE
jgi:hypothetical protein